MLESNRIKRVFIVAGLGIIGVCLITLLSSAGTDDARRRVGVKVDPTERPDAPTTTDPGSKPGISTIRETEDPVIQLVDPKTGRLQREFAAARLTPHEQGVIDMVKPRARLFLAPWRVIQMESDTGRFVAPDNQPESGEFSGNLVITIFQIDAKDAERGAKLDLSADSPHRVVKLKLDRATFDTTLGEVRSDSKVELMTPATKAAYFRGRGLTLVYNEVSSRVDYLEITHGDMLRYRPGAAAELEREARPGKPKPPVAAREGEPRPAEPAAAAGAQFYRVTFEKQVKASTEGRVVDADSLVVYFAVDKPRNQDAATARVEPMGPAPGLRGPDRFAASRTPNLLPLIFAVDDSAPATPAKPAAKPAAAPAPAQPLSDDPDAPLASPQDLVLTWAGKMVMVPVESKPPQIAGEQDTFLRFTGAPVVVTLEDRDRMQCAEIEFLDSTKTITAVGSPAFPLRIESPVLGTIIAPKLTANVDTSSGQLVGAGSIRAPEKPLEGDADRLPPGFRIDWSDRVDLAFAAKDKPKPVGDAAKAPAVADADKADAIRDAASGIESATFHGDVRVEDAQMKLTAGTLTARFDVPPGAKSSDRQMSAIDAAGNVHVAFEDARIDAATLRVETAPNPQGRLTPVRMVADGRVVVVDPTQQLAADSLDVTLVERPKKDKPGDKPAAPGAPAKPDAGKLSLNERMAVDVDKITAIGKVELTMKSDTVVKGDRLNADATAGTAVLLGDPVRIVRGGDEAAGIPPEAELIVPRLNLERNGKVALAEGAGVFVYTEPATDSLPPRKDPAAQPDDAAKPDKPARPQAEDTHRRRVRVTWTDRMRYDDSANIIQVFGSVAAKAEDAADEVNELTAGQMTLELVDPRTIERALDGAAAGPMDQPIDAGLNRRQLRRLTARDDVTLKATKWTGSDHKDVETRVLMKGPILVFNNISEQAQIIGPGYMLIEDRRPPEPPEAGAKPDTARKPIATKATPISGRGATAFTWTNRLLLDNGSTDMTIEGGVKLTHQPADADKVLTLDADRLVADLESSTAIRAMAMTRSDSLTVRKVVAVGGVQVHDRATNRMVTTDQLVYNGVDETVLLTAAEGRKVNIVQLDQPKPVRAATVYWDLKNDTVEIRDAGF